MGAWVRFSFIGNLLAYPLYLWKRSPGRVEGNHYDWTVCVRERERGREGESARVSVCV